MKFLKFHPLALGVLLASGMPVLADHELDALVITAPQASSVLKVETDPKAPRQPIPAQDGADLLKNIPGFAVVRKGGTDGDPLFRGMAASRLSILMDGENVLGGCGNRMDPPTAYIFPEAYDNVTILKGPQSVKYGPGSSAGVVNFERATPEFYDSPVHGYVSALAGSFGRNDQVGQIQAGGQKGYIELKGMRSESRDYKDGNGDKIHSNYERWSTNATLGWTPNVDTKVELTGALSDGEAAYGDRGMDGSKFKRENIGLSYQQEHVTELLAQVKARVYRNYVDHVMDNYSLRTPPPKMGMMGGPMAMNPDRESIGAAASGMLVFDAHRKLDIGIDYQTDQHSDRMGMGVNDHRNQVRKNDIKSQNLGVYSEFYRHYPGDHELHLGLRFDHNKAEDQRHDFATHGETDTQWLTSGFVRYEHQLSKENRAYAGIGHSQRAADYWERTRTPDGNMHHGTGHDMMQPSTSTFNTNPEKLTQLDIGIMHSGKTLQASLSAFYAYHDDYILVEEVVHNGMTGSNARSINATTFGGEADVVWRFAHNWNTLTALSYVHGKNRSDDRALGQIPAPEMRLGLTYDTGLWTAGALWRGVAHQNRVAIGQGNVVGLDTSATSGYGVFSLNAGYRVGDNLLITAGLDNLFDRAYAEHISRSSASVPGYDQVTGKVNELGRNIWLKAQYTF